MMLYFRMEFRESKSLSIFWTPWWKEIRPMVMACYQTSLAALQPKGPAIHWIFWGSKCVPDAWHWNVGMPPPFKAGLSSFLGQLGIELSEGPIMVSLGGVCCFCSGQTLWTPHGWGIWKQWGSCAQLEPQWCFHLPSEDCPVQKTLCLCSPAGANQGSYGPLSNVNNAFLLLLFFVCLFVYIIFSWNYKLKTQMGLHGSLWPTKDFYILLAQWPFQEAEGVSQWRVADTFWFSLGVGERARWLSLLWGNCPHHPPQVTIAFCWNNAFLNGI